MTGFPGTVDSVNIIGPNEIEVTLTTTAATGTYDIVLSNTGGALNTQWSGNGEDQLEVFAPVPWTDLRSGGNTFSDGNGAGNDIRYRTGMALARDANGMYFTGSNPWSSWVKFESMGWTRGEDRTVQWVFTSPTNAMMIGISSDATNETATDQYRQGENHAYFQNSTTLWGLYGNNGTPGGTGNQANTATISASGVYKIKFESDGGAGGTFTLYELPSAAPADWDNEATVVTTFTIGGTLAPDEANLFPAIIPRDGDAQRFIAVKVE